MNSIYQLQQIHHSWHDLCSKQNC